MVRWSFFHFCELTRQGIAVHHNLEHGQKASRHEPGPDGAPSLLVYCGAEGVLCHFRSNEVPRYPLLTNRGQFFGNSQVLWWPSRATPHSANRRSAWCSISEHRPFSHKLALEKSSFWKTRWEGSDEGHPSSLLAATGGGGAASGL